MISRRVLACRVWLTGLEGIADLAAMLKGFVRVVEACDSSDPSSLDVILKWSIVEWDACDDGLTR